MHRIDWFWNCLKFWIYVQENRKKVVINTMCLKYAMWNTWHQVSSDINETSQG